MSTRDDGALRARLDRLERIARRDRALALGALALLFATAQAPGAAQPGATAPLVVTAPSGASARIAPTGLSVRDVAGKVRVAAWIDDNGSPSFDESEASGALRQSMYLFKGTQSPQLEQYDAQGKRRDEIFIGSDTQTPDFAILDEKRTVRLEAFQASGHDPEISLRGSDDKVRAFIEGNEAVPFLSMRDRSGQVRVHVGAYTTGAIGMDIRDAQNKDLWNKP